MPGNRAIFNNRIDCYNSKHRRFDTRTDNENTPVEHTSLTDSSSSLLLVSVTIRLALIQDKLIKCFLSFLPPVSLSNQNENIHYS